MSAVPKQNDPAEWSFSFKKYKMLAIWNLKATKDFFFFEKKKKNNQRKCHASTTQKLKFSIKDFFGKCDQIRKSPRIWSYLPKKSLIGNVIFLQCMCSNIQWHFYEDFSRFLNIKSKLVLQSFIFPEPWEGLSHIYSEEFCVTLWLSLYWISIKLQLKY